MKKKYQEKPKPDHRKHFASKKYLPKFVGDEDQFALPEVHFIGLKNADLQLILALHEDRSVVQ